MSFSDDPVVNRTQLEDAIKVLILLYIKGNSKPQKQLMERQTVGALNFCSQWIRDMFKKEYPDEGVYSKKKIDVNKFIE